MLSVWILSLGACSLPETDTAVASSGPLGFPLLERERFEVVIGVDHDPGGGSTQLDGLDCLNFDGDPFPACYNQHRGTDFLLEGGFDTWDTSAPAIVAAAAGEVIAVSDEGYDRCHGDIDGVSCDGYPMELNSITLQHEGFTTEYQHLKQHSAVVALGDDVTCGQVLGAVGSSGNSSSPHLHLELRDDANDVINPYAGRLSQKQSWWAEQEASDGLPGAGCAAP